MMCVIKGAHVCHGAYMEVREQFCRVDCLFLPRCIWGRISDHWACVTTKVSHHFMQIS